MKPNSHMGTARLEQAGRGSPAPLPSSARSFQLRRLQSQEASSTVRASQSAEGYPYCARTRPSGRRLQGETGETVGNGGARGLGAVAAPNGRTLAAPASDMPRVLIIEDDEGFADVLVRALGTDAFDLTVVNKGMDGLEIAAEQEFDLLILDLLLPDIDGISLLRRLLAARPEQQVLIVSALSNVEAKVRCLDLGAADYLAKPFALDELVARVRARVRQGHSRESSRVLREGTLTLDIQRRVATSDGRVVHLSAREFFLLEYLMRHEGEICTREELLHSVWGYSHDPGTNVVDVYVRRLRRKIGEFRIETIRNVGYGLRAA